MKKKHRDITVDGVTYGWITKRDDGTTTTRVFKEKKEWFSFTTKGDVVNPVDVSNVIKKELAK